MTNFNNIPHELKMNGLFCVWKLDEGRGGKIPFNPVTKTLAKSNNPNTFNSYKTIFEYLPDYYKINNQGQVLGGLGLGIFNGYSAIDIDDCRDNKGKLSPMAEDIIKYINSYTEISPSGRGIRIIFKTDDKINKDTHYINNRNLGLEIYISDNTNKYVTLTGNKLSGDSINSINISYVLEKYMKKHTHEVIINEPSNIANIELKINSELKYNKKFKDAWNATAPGSGSNESELDMSLTNHLAFIFEGDYGSIKEAFELSPYFASKDDKHKEKWLVRTDYRESTIKNAITSFHAYNIAREQEFEFTDSGNANKFVANFGSQIKYNVDNKRWMIYNGNYWQTDIYNYVKSLADMTIEQLKIEAMNSYGEEQKAMKNNVKRLLSSYGKESMLKEAQHLDGIPVSNGDFDNEPYLLNTASGVVDLRDGTIISADKMMMLSMYTDILINKNEPKIFLKFLDEIFMGDKELIDWFQLVAGYTLTGYTKEQAMFIFLGDGANGKSLLLDTMLKVLGSYGTTAGVDLLVDRRSQSSNLSEVARLDKIRLVVSEEAEHGDRLRESSIKSMTSDHGEITARYLYGNEFTFKPIFKIFMATNYQPIIRGTDHGIWRRIRVVPFNLKIPDHKQDRNLGAKFNDELGSILWWMIEGAMKWFKIAYIKTPKAITGAVTTYRSEMDLVQRWINDNCELGDNFATSSIDLFKNISQYIYDNKEYQLSNTMFGRNMSKKFEKRRIANKTMYIGIRIREVNMVDALDDIEVKEDI